MPKIKAPDDRNRISLEQPCYEYTKFESNAVRYKAGLLYLINSYPESVPPFNDKIIHQMLKVVCGCKQKVKIRHRILQSFQREAKRVKEDLEKLRANKDAEIYPLERNCEMNQIKYVVEIIMRKYMLSLQKDNCKSPPLSIIEEILLALESLNLKDINRKKVENVALVWLKKNVNINKAKTVQNIKANIPSNFNVASSEANIVPELQSLPDEKFTEITDTTQDSEFTYSEENEFDNIFFSDEESLFIKNELMMDCEGIDECNSTIFSGDIYPDALDFVDTTGFDYLQKSIDFSSNHTVAHASDIPASPRPELKILTQPSNRIIFLYISNSRASYCSTLDQNEGLKLKKPPAVKLINYVGKAFIRCQLVTDEKHKRLPHAHKLAQKKGQSLVMKDFYEAQVSEDNEYTAEFPQMNIIQTSRKDFKEELFRKKQIEVIIKKLKQKEKESSTFLLSDLEVTELQKFAKEEAQTMNSNSVALCFQAFYRDNEGTLRKLTDPVYSRTINNLKSINCGRLKICRIQKRGSSCEGSEETFMLVSKVSPDSIRIKFYELDEFGKEIWCDYGKFSKADVHCQTTIVFRTPPYKDTNITSSKDVYVKLESISNGACSNSVRFTYEPSGTIPIEKRARMSSVHTEIIIPNNQVNSTCTENSTKHLCQKESIQFEKIKTEISEVVNDFENVIEKSQSDDDSSFAADLLVKVLNVMKENPLDERKRIMDLLKELTNYGDTPLHVAIRYNQTQTIESLVVILSLYPELKFIVNTRNNSGKTPLHLAVVGNLPIVIKTLLILGADPNCKDKDDCSPLDIAITSLARTDCVDVILSASQSSDIPIDKYLHLAAKIGSLDSLKLLIKAGANVNSVDVNCGRTILHFAVENLHKDIVEYLIRETQIDINMKNFEGKTAFQIAMTLKGFKAEEICTSLIRARLRLSLL